MGTETDGPFAGVDLGVTLPALAAGADAHPHRIAVVDAGLDVRLNWAGLAAAVTEQAEEWRSAGAVPGRRLALMLDPAPTAATVVAFLAALATGAAVVPVNARFRPGEQREVLEAAAPVVAVTPRSGPEPHLVQFGGAAVGDPDDRLIVLSSGTTGRPKGIRHTAHTLDASARAVSAYFGFGHDDAWMCPLPLVHVGGIATIWRVLTQQATLICADPGDAALQARLVAATDGPTHVSLVPTQLTRLVEAGVSPGPRLRWAQIGGAGVDPVVRARANELGLRVVPTYGMTEMASTVVVDGRPIDGVKVSVVDDSGDPVPHGVEGTVVVDGPMRSPGYAWGGPATFEAGVQTSDRGLREADGHLYVLGRSDDMLVVGGENVHPLEIERILATHPDVYEALVSGRADAEFGTVIVAEVVCREGHVAPTAAALREFCREHLAAYKVPREFAVVAALPRNAMGKLIRPR